MYEEDLREYYNGSKESTIKTYAYHLNRLGKLRGLEEKEELADLMSDAFENTKVIKESNFSENLKHNMIVFLSLFSERMENEKEVTSAYKKIAAESQEKINEMRQNNIVAKKHEDAWVRWKDICKVYDLIEIKDMCSCQEKLIVGLYTRLGYVLRLDFANMPYLEEKECEQADKEKRNYICDKNDSYIIVLHDYKTYKKYGKVEINIVDDDLRKLLDLWFSKYNKKKLWLLVSSRNDKNPLNKDLLSSKIKDIFEKYIGKEITNQILRQIFETEVVYGDSKNYNEMTIREKEKAHRRLLHGIITGQMYAKKTFMDNNKTIEDDDD
jgi:hypothetical protein